MSIQGVNDRRWRCSWKGDGWYMWASMHVYPGHTQCVCVIHTHFLYAIDSHRRACSRAHTQPRSGAAPVAQAKVEGTGRRGGWVWEIGSEEGRGVGGALNCVCKHLCEQKCFVHLSVSVCVCVCVGLVFKLRCRCVFWVCVCLSLCFCVSLCVQMHSCHSTQFIS